MDIADADPTLRAILDLARWAPSGDNTQPWRFEVRGARSLRIHGFDTRDHCVYDLDGRPSQISLGALIETLCLAARWHGLEARVERQPGTPETHPIFAVEFQPTELPPKDAHLVREIPRRSVYRFSMSTRPLTPTQKAVMEQALPPGYCIRWFESLGDRWRMARLMFRNAHLRLTMAEAFAVHSTIIDWGQRFSADKIPDQALGADNATLRLMKWAMRDWSRVQFMNRWLGGTLAPRIQMDLLPSLRCAAHFALVRERAPLGIDDHVDVGRAVQRVWLAASHGGLRHQPEITPLVFARYAAENRRFSADAGCIRQAAGLRQFTEQALAPEPLAQVVWLGRLGEAPSGANGARSLRHPMDTLQR